MFFILNDMYVIIIIIGNLSSIDISRNEVVFYIAYRHIVYFVFSNPSLYAFGDWTAITNFYCTSIKCALHHMVQMLTFKMRSSLKC